MKSKVLKLDSFDHLSKSLGKDNSHIWLYLTFWISFVFLWSELCICPTTFAGIIHYGVFCRKEAISKGTRFGPFKGKVVNTSEIKTFDDNSFMWEVALLSFFLFFLSSLYTNIYTSLISACLYTGNTHLLVISVGQYRYIQCSMYGQKIHKLTYFKGFRVN